MGQALQKLAWDRLEKEQKRFMTNPQIDGSVPIPPGMTLTLTTKDGKTDYITRSESISAQPAQTRQLIKTLKRLSNSNRPEREREYGAMVVTYIDGTTRAIKVTSNMHQTIRGRDQSKGADESGIFSEPEKIASVTHFHTHPDLTNPYLDHSGGKLQMIPSLGDYNMYQTLQGHLSKLAGHNIPIHGIVIPNCSFCDDLIFTAEITGETAPQ